MTGAETGRAIAASPGGPFVAAPGKEDQTWPHSANTFSGVLSDLFVAKGQL